jgi:4-hydroxymandelate oxidase
VSGPLLNLDAYERAAAERLAPGTLAYYASGAGDELTLRENRAAFERLLLRPRVLRGVATRDLGTTLVGRRHPFPVLIAPTAQHALAHPEGELATARAAAALGVTFTLSTIASRSLEDVATASGPRWFQLYVYRDRALTRALVQRAEAAGYEALVLTVDAPLLGRRERAIASDERPAMRAGNLEHDSMRALLADGATADLAAYFAAQIDPGLSIEDVAWLRSISTLPVLVKGVVRGDDAAAAIEAGAAGVVVSNHGGRQVDTTIATIDALPEVVRAVAGRGAVLLDGGVRRGTDVVKALALGAQAVLVGRPVLWALAVDGERGVRDMLEVLRAEIDLAFALCGVRGVSEATPDLIA